MVLGDWLERHAPDFLATWQRFSFSILLAAVNTAIVIGIINGTNGLQDEIWLRAALGVATAAVLAVAGVFYSESQPTAPLRSLFFVYIVPLLAILAAQVTDIFWLVPWAMPVVAILWLSVSPFTRMERGAPRAEQQDRFWWMNARAVSTAVLAAAAFLVIALGLAAIERSLSILFGLDTGRVFYQWLLPFVGLFLAPVYWLATLPRIAEFRSDELGEAEFSLKAVGFLGQFILVPLLFIYALILLAYAGQIVVTQRLPQGMIGWMVLGFVVAGAGTWLLLHPAFMRKRPLVRLFRAWWFWLTLPPLALFFVAVWVRVDAYGFTAERMLLLAGGAWAVMLALAYVFGRGDIRLIPALAGAILLLLSVGPWNYSHLPMVQHLTRLDAVIMKAGADTSASPPRSDWSAEEIAEARAAIDYLTMTREGRRGVRDVMGKYGVTWDAAQDGSYVVLDALGVEQPTTDGIPRFATLWRDYANAAVDLSRTPYLIRPIGIYGNGPVDAAPLRFEAQGGVLRVGAVASPPEVLQTIDVDSWLAGQGDATVTSPWLEFTVEGRRYRLVVDSVTFDRGENNAGPRVLSSIVGQLFSDRG